MGTVRHATGTITFDPPLTAGELRSDLFHAFTVVEDNGFAVQLPVDEEPVETADGTLIRQWANRIIPTWGSDGVDISYYGNRHIPGHLAELVAALGPRTYSGQIEVCADIAYLNDFEAYRLRVFNAPAGPPVVYRTNAMVLWEDAATEVVRPKAGQR